MTKIDPNDVYEATETFTADADGVPTVVTKGMTRVRASDAVYRNNPHFFRPLTISTDVEAATAAPGEKRGAK
jgi:hypothetical protein